MSFDDLPKAGAATADRPSRSGGVVVVPMLAAAAALAALAHWTAELRGLKVRGGHLIVRALHRLGADVVSLPSNRELTTAFAENRLDANFGVTPLTGIFLPPPRVASVYHFPTNHSPAFLFELLIGPETGPVWVICSGASSMRPAGAISTVGRKAFRSPKLTR